MYRVELTETEMKLIRDALETEYYHAKDEGDKAVMRRITRLEDKLTHAEKGAIE